MDIASEVNGHLTKGAYQLLSATIVELSFIVLASATGSTSFVKFSKSNWEFQASFASFYLTVIFLLLVVFLNVVDGVIHAAINKKSAIEKDHTSSAAILFIVSILILIAGNALFSISFVHYFVSR